MTPQNTYHLFFDSQSPYSLNEEKIFMRQKAQEFAYSDGDNVEESLLAGLQSVKDVSLASDELQSLICDWPSEYHLTPLRANLLAPFNLSQVKTVLEVGSGCGAITRFLGEQGKDLLALEGSRRRATITKERCRELENVSVCCDSFDSFVCGTKFDCVTLIGVLEYSPSFTPGSNPFMQTLKKAISLLNDTGILIVAIENLLGLKYFNGCSEDHSGTPFLGLNDQYPPDKYKTFGRFQLLKMLTDAGLLHNCFYYPFPDYKLPQFIFGEQAVKNPKIDLAAIAGQYEARDYGAFTDRVFNEKRLWPLLQENNLVMELANSFLLFASRVPIDQKTVQGEHWLAQSFSAARKKKYLTVNVFRENEEEIFVEKCLQYQEDEKDSAQTLPVIQHRVGKESYVKGRTYDSWLCGILNKEDIVSEYCTYLSPWINFLLNSPDLKDDNSISGSYLDCVPSNLIVNDDGQLQRIDQEWTFPGDVDISYILFRGIYRDLRLNNRELSTTELFNRVTVFELVKRCCAEHDLDFDEDILEGYISREIDIQLEIIVYPATEKELRGYLHDFFMRKQDVKPSMGTFLREGGLQRYSRLAKDLEHAVAKGDFFESELQAVRTELNMTRNCLSWKLGRFLTALPRKIRQMFGL